MCRRYYFMRFLDDFEQKEGAKSKDLAPSLWVELSCVQLIA